MISGLILGGCAPVSQVKYQPLSLDKNLKHEYVTEKNYTLNIGRDAYIGESMIRVQNYTKIENPNFMKVSKDFSFNNQSALNNIQAKFSSADRFEIDGMCTIDGVEYTILKHPKLDSKFRFLVDGQGNLYNRTLLALKAFNFQANDYMLTQHQNLFEPSDVKLDRFLETVYTPESINYEIVYTGKDKESLKLLYREFTPNDLARTAFFQTLTYDLNSKKIRFKNLNMKIDQVNNEKISFTVLSD